MMMIRRLNIGEGMLYREARLASLKESPEAFSSSYAVAISRSEHSWHEQADSSASGIDRATFIAIDDTPVGLAAIYRDENEPEVGELIQMWIAPEKRGGPAARDLLEAVTQWAASNGFSQIKAEVVTKNSRALRFYEKCGFFVSSDSAALSGSSVMLTKSVAKGNMARRPSTDGDYEYAKRIHHTAYREWIVAQFGPWDEKIQDEFFHESWNRYDYEMFLLDLMPCGYCAVEYSDREVRVREFAVDPEFQGKGIGYWFLRDLIATHDTSTKPVRLNAFKANPSAIAYYLRFGFQQIGEIDLQLEFEWRGSSIKAENEQGD